MVSQQPQQTRWANRRPTGVDSLRYAATAVAIVCALAGSVGFAQSSTVPTETVTVTFWNIWGGTRAPLLREILDRFEESNPGIRVENVTVDAAIVQQQMIAAVAAGNPPDLYMTAGFELTQWENIGGFIRPLDDFIARDGLDLGQHLIPATIEGSTINGRVMQLPFKLATPMMIWFNKDLFVEAGLDPDDPPETWSELRDAAVRLTKTRGRIIDQLGINMCINCSDTGPEVAFAEWHATNAGHLFDADHVVSFDDARGVETLEFMISVMEDTVGGFNNMASQLGVDWRSQRPAFYEGRIAMHMDGPWFLDILRTEAPEVVEKVGVFLLPYNDGNPNAEHRGVTYGVPGYFIPAGAKNADAAWEVLKHVALAHDGGCWFFLRQQRVDTPILGCEDPAASEANPHIETFRALAATTQSIPAPANFEAIRLRLKEMQDSALRGVETPMAATSGAAREVRGLLGD